MSGCEFTEKVFVDLIRINAYAIYHDKHNTFSDETLSISNAFAWCIYQNIDILLNLRNMYTGMRSILVAFNVSIALIEIISISRHAE